MVNLQRTTEDPINRRVYVDFYISPRNFRQVYCASRFHRTVIRIAMHNRPSVGQALNVQHFDRVFPRVEAMALKKEAYMRLGRFPRQTSYK